MSEIEIENRIKYLKSLIPDKKHNIEKIMFELENICKEILSLEEKLKEINVKK